jgi:outer membrane protein OmpA-like peptidoglycan-associated protein
MTLDLGIRVVPPVRGLSFMAGVEFGLTGTSSFVRELAPTTPYRVLLAVGYDYDARPGEIRVVEKPVEVADAGPPEGRVSGLITEQGADAPVAGAAVRFTGKEELSAVQSGDDGRFSSYAFEAGSEVEMELSHPAYESARCSALIPAEGGEVETHCWMTPLPETGEIKGRVVDQWGAPVPGARVELSGPSTALITTDENGVFQQQVQAGQYAFKVDAIGYLMRTSSLTLAARGSASPEVMLSARPTPGKVSLQGNQIRINAQFKFMPNSSEPHPSASPLIAELADLLLRNPQINRIRIEGPNPGPVGDGIMALNRAVAIKQRLAAAGVSVDRIDAAGGNTPRLRIAVE